MLAHQSQREIATSSRGEDALQSEPADIHSQSGAGEVRKGQAVLCEEFRTPVHIDVVAFRLTRRLRPGRDHDEPLVQQRLDRETWTRLGRVHHTDLSSAFYQSVHQIVFESSDPAYGDIGSELGEDGQPSQHQALPQSDPATDRQGRAVSTDDADLLTCLLYGSGEKRGVALKLAPCRCQRGPGLVADEQLGPELLLETLDPGADSGLRNVKALRGVNEATRCDDGEKRTGEFGIHRKCRYLTPIIVACKIDGRV